MGEPGERDHIRLVSVIQYILCFVGLSAVARTGRTYGIRNTAPVTVSAQVCCREYRNRVTGCRQPSATVLLRPYTAVIRCTKY
jgi:hypothetical protein